MEKKRSIGVTIFGLLLLTPVIPLSVNFISTFSDPLYKDLGFLNDYRFLIRISLTHLGAALPLIILSIGILQLKNWARIICLWVAVIGGFFMFTLGMALGGVYGITFIIIAEALFVPAIFAIPIIFFLTRPKVKEQFR